MISEKKPRYQCVTYYENNDSCRRIWNKAFRRDTYYSKTDD